MYLSTAISDISCHLNLPPRFIGVYILYNEIECRYVGESINVISRVQQHYQIGMGYIGGGGHSGGGFRKSHALKTDEVRIVKFIEVRNELLRKVTEAFWDWKLKPTLAARPSPYPAFIEWSDSEVFAFIKKDFKSRRIWENHHERRI